MRTVSPPLGSRRVFSGVHLNMNRENLFNPVLPMYFIKFLPSFTQTSLEALYALNPGCGGLTLSFLWHFWVIPE